MTNVFCKVSKLKSKYCLKWWNCNTQFYPFEKKYSKLEKKSNENQLDNSIQNFFSLADKIPNENFLDSSNDKEIGKIKREFKDRAKKVLKIENPDLEAELIDGFTDVTEKFIKKAKQFDPEVDISDIMQAMRNVWIMNLIQLILNKEAKFTPSIFAYSMLYPYTDNYLDKPDVSQNKKNKFNRLLYKRLKGLPVEPLNHNQHKVFELLKMIEKQYDRNCFPFVYQSIIAIHKAQNKSLMQQKGMLSPYEKDILSISVQKGGTSVLADAYLVNGNVNDDASMEIFGFGFLLQLIDDLQDAVEDLKNRHMTIFSQTGEYYKLDSITNKLISLTFSVPNFNNLATPFSCEIKKLIRDNCLMLIFEAIAKNKKLYSKKYLRKLEPYCPVHFKSFKRIRKKTQKKYRSFL